MDTLAEAISTGTPVLLENMRKRITFLQFFPFLIETFVVLDEFIDSSLYQILERNIVPQKCGKMAMLCGGKLIEYNDNFRLYMTSSLPNPHYLPEIASKITLLDFTLTEQGLQQKILSTIIGEERIDLQERKEAHIAEMAKNTELLYKLESNILEVLSSSEGNILEDEMSLNILSTSKSMSEEIQAKQISTAAVAQQIDSQRREYLFAARHASIIYRCITRLASINYMYQYSLNWFVNMFIRNVRETPKRHQTLSQHLHEINDNFTKRAYRTTAATLYKRDRLAFAFLICIEVLRTQNHIQDEELGFLLTNKILQKPYHPQQAIISLDWMNFESKHLLNLVSKLPRYSAPHCVIRYFYKKAC